MNTSSRFAADTRKLAYAQAFSRTSAPHAAAHPEGSETRAECTSRTPLQAFTSRLHRSRRTAR